MINDVNTTGVSRESDDPPISLTFVCAVIDRFKFIKHCCIDFFLTLYKILDSFCEIFLRLGDSLLDLLEDGRLFFGCPE